MSQEVKNELLTTAMSYITSIIKSTMDPRYILGGFIGGMLSFGASFLLGYFFHTAGIIFPTIMFIISYKTKDVVRYVTSGVGIGATIWFSPYIIIAFGTFGFIIFITKNSWWQAVKNFICTFTLKPAIMVGGRLIIPYTYQGIDYKICVKPEVKPRGRGIIEVKGADDEYRLSNDKEVIEFLGFDKQWTGKHIPPKSILNYNTVRVTSGLNNKVSVYDLVP